LIAEHPLGSLSIGHIVFLHIMMPLYGGAKSNGSKCGDRMKRASTLF
jgi:hypothetical protein